MVSTKGDTLPLKVVWTLILIPQRWREVERVPIVSEFVRFDREISGAHRSISFVWLTDVASPRSWVSADGRTDCGTQNERAADVIPGGGTWVSAPSGDETVRAVIFRHQGAQDSSGDHEANLDDMMA